MSLQPGHKLLHYEVVEQVGEGGMGVVWKAHDTTLGRDVAIKVLPPPVAQDHDRLARLETEAKTLAKLNHPNIASVFGLHELGETRFVAMEYVAGEDLARRLARHRLTVAEALEYARQIADALHSAHENGVVHRDLKPANVMLTPEGAIKVLDFGLAKAFETDPAVAANPSLSPTLTSHGTVPGVIFGTAGYMSPEQARGDTADKRSDVFAFGALLYEMLTGTRAFQGDTVTDTLASVLKLDPDWSQLPANLPRGIRRLIERCLRKDPRERLHDIADARIEIVEALSEGAAGRVDEAPAASRWGAAVWALVALAAGVAIGWGLKPAAPERAVRRFVVRSDDVTHFPQDPRISPDGSKVLYRAADRLHVRDLERGETREIAETEGAEEPFWSPDGGMIGYRAGSGLWKVDTIGGTPTQICDLADMTDAAWNDSGTIGIIRGNRLLEVPARGGEPSTVLELDKRESEDFHGIDAIPDRGGWVVIVHDVDGTNALEVVHDGARRRLAAHDGATLWAARYAAPGYVLYHRQGKNQGVWAVPLRENGEPFLVTAGGSNPSAARDGTLAYLEIGAAQPFELVRVARDGSDLEVYGETAAGLANPTLSPDGKALLFRARENDEWDLWLHDVVRGTRMRLTSEGGREGVARWSADGSRIYFYGPVGNSLARIYSLPAGGGEPPLDLVHGKTPTVSSDAGWMVFARFDEETDYDLWSWRLDGESEPERWLTAEGEQHQAVLSPDGRWLAYASEESGDFEVYIKPFPSGSGRWQVSVGGGRMPSWSDDGKRLYYVDWGNDENALYEVELTYGEQLELSAPRLYLDFGKRRLQSWYGYEIFPDGESVFAVRQAAVDEEERENAMPGGVIVVQNWLAEIRD